MPKGENGIGVVVGDYIANNTKYGSAGGLSQFASRNLVEDR